MAVVDVVLECPRCGPRFNNTPEGSFPKTTKVNMETHERYCPDCHYTWMHRDGMPEAPGEFEKQKEPAAAPEVAAAAPAGGPEVAGGKKKPK